MPVVRCPLCGAPHAACGPHTQHHPVDIDFPRAPKEDPMDLQIYDVVINGHPTTAKLTPAQAQRLGATLAPAAKPAAEGEGGEAPAKRKRGRPANKSA